MPLVGAALHLAIGSRDVVERARRFARLYTKQRTKSGTAQFQRSVAGRNSFTEGQVKALSKRRGRQRYRPEEG